ncbi:MAG: hypothetical protein IJW63_01525 [Lachnospiraceae bacterium]|nr:hypothetical protein [Lachnospiraceae bacterium]
MWQIILQILAIIGIILLTIIGLILVVALLVLFVPIRYKALLDVDTACKKYSGEGKASWLLKLLTLHVTYPEPAKLTVRVLGIIVKEIDFNKTEEMEEIPSSKEPTAESTEQVKINDEIEVKEDKEKAKEKLEVKEVVKEEVKVKEKVEEKVEEKEDIKERSIEEPKQKWYEKILYTIKNLCVKIKEIWNNIEYYKDLLNKKANRQFFERSKKRIFKLLKGIAPKRCKGQLRVGTGSPDTTGYLLAIYGMFVPYLDKDFYLEPDFEEAICQGKLLIKGRIYLITVLVCILGFVFDKQLFVLLKELKREEQ